MWERHVLKVETNLADVVFSVLSPVPEITWKRANGVPFPSKVKMKYSNAVLEIPSFQQDDTGGYECVAENRMGKNTAAGRLAFYGTQTLSFPAGCQTLVLLSTHAWTISRLSSSAREKLMTRNSLKISSYKV